MTSKLSASLTEKIDEWIEDNCDDEGRPDGYISGKLAVHMAKGAIATWDAAFDAQEFAKNA